VSDQCIGQCPILTFYRVPESL